MNFANHDPALMVWGVATAAAGGQLAVRAHRSRALAEATAEQVPQLTVAGRHPTTGAHCSISAVSPLVYSHAEQGWTLAAIGWPLPDRSAE
ncbi:hypothetical protein AVR91_0204320 [Amycolatopsis keratiniphila subsp. keratiniphila]|uniref:Uncharacterized protein n=1 Tax=Amycolatopsis keratiniphila subsp. keratiniphila TaxID=227715 RepID=A0A1W2M277_9PSEU|nr:hypothetical protein AVR91_0204320 [Amycolatopsis keratiniphila subsp. keratiniphila]